VGLTEEQRAVVRHGRGHAKVTAVAGSGKTATMIARVVHLLRQGGDPRLIRVVMFNKAAQVEFSQRLARAAGGMTERPPVVSTFHAMGKRLTEAFVRRGMLPDYELCPHEWRQGQLARQALASAIQQAGAGWGQPDKLELEDFLTFIDRVKADLARPSEVFAAMGLSQNVRYFLAAYEAFEDLRRSEGLRFFSDLLFDPVVAMAESPELRAWVGDRLEHVIVDEYQDVSAVQQALLQVVAGSRASVMAVGDEDQCIYAWRGSRPELITTTFAHDFPGAAVYRLSRTFRYGHALSLLANHAITANRQREDKLCISAEGTPHTRVALTVHGRNDPHPLPGILASWRAQGRALREVVVLVRLRSMSIPVELALLKEQLAYRVDGPTAFDTREMRALVGVLRLAAGTLFDPDDEHGRAETVRAMLSVPHVGLRAPEMQALVQRIVGSPQHAPGLIVDAVRQQGGRPRQRERAETMAGLWSTLASGRWRGLPPRKILGHYIETTGLYDHFREMAVRHIEAEERIVACEELMAFAEGQGKDLEGLLAGIDELRAAAARQRGDEDLVRITTVHQAKGLEFPVVVVPGLAEGRFPYVRDASEEAEMEEERRLFYVAVTRAREQLHLLAPPDRAHGAAVKTGSRAIPETPVASRFLYEANIGISRRLGRAIEAGDPARTLAQLRASDPEVAQGYLAAIGVSTRSARPGRSPSAIREPAAGSD